MQLKEPSAPMHARRRSRTGAPPLLLRKSKRALPNWNAAGMLQTVLDLKLGLRCKPGATRPLASRGLGRILKEPAHEFEADATGEGWATRFGMKCCASAPRLKATAACSTRRAACVGSSCARASSSLSSSRDTALLRQPKKSICCESVSVGPLLADAMRNASRS
eukprot:3759976-Pleurochrysis_carterae.AAC.1